MNDEESKRSSLKEDLKRMGIVLLVIAFLNIIDMVIPLGPIAYMTSVLSTTSVLLFIAAASHLMRKIFFPKLSMTKFAEEAMSHPIGAALVFLGISMVLSSLILVNVLLLK